MTSTTSSSSTTTDPAGAAQTAADQVATDHVATDQVATDQTAAGPSSPAPVPAAAAPALSDEETLAAARSLAPLVSPQDAAGHLAAGGLLLDVRSAAGRATTGSIDGARITDRADLGPELDPTASPSVLAAAGGAGGNGAAGDGARLPVSLDTPIVVVCGSERGSGPVAAELIARGYTDVRQVDGGAPGWAAAGLPLTR